MGNGEGVTEGGVLGVLWEDLADLPPPEKRHPRAQHHDEQGVVGASRVVRLVEGGAVGANAEVKQCRQVAEDCDRFHPEYHLINIPAKL